MSRGAVFFCWFWLEVLQKKEEGGGDAVTGHIISTTIGGKNGEPKRVSFFRGILVSVLLCVQWNVLVLAPFALLPCS